jgi:hypothetical protein
VGTWDVSVFGNDDAADFSFDFDDADTVEAVVPILETALDSVLNTDDYIDASEGATGLVAAALVVAWDQPEMIGDDAAYAPEPWPRAGEPLPPHLSAKAASVMDRLLKGESNELAELWNEADGVEEFRAEIMRWRSRL